MTRRLLTICSVVGLVGSLGLWGMSYWDFKFVDGGFNVWLKSGRLSMFDGWPLQQQLEWSVNVELFQQVRREHWLQEGYNAKIGHMLAHKQKCAFFGFEGFQTQWWTGDWPYPLSGLGATHVPMWIPAVVFAGGLTPSFISFSRRHRRHKLGLCVACGYDLRGSEGWCPECGDSPTRSGGLSQMQKTLKKMYLVIELNLLMWLVAYGIVYTESKSVSTWILFGLIFSAVAQHWAYYACCRKAQELSSS